MFNTLHVAHDITGHSTIAQKKLHFNVFDFFLCQQCLGGKACFTGEVALSFHHITNFEMNISEVV